SAPGTCYLRGLVGSRFTFLAVDFDVERRGEGQCRAGVGAVFNHRSERQGQAGQRFGVRDREVVGADDVGARGVQSAYAVAVAEYEEPCGFGWDRSFWNLNRSVSFDHSVGAVVELQ